MIAVRLTAVHAHLSGSYTKEPDDDFQEKYYNVLQMVYDACCISGPAQPRTQPRQCQELPCPLNTDFLDNRESWLNQTVNDI